MFALGRGRRQPKSPRAVRENLHVDLRPTIARVRRTDVLTNLVKSDEHVLASTRIGMFRAVGPRLGALPDAGDPTLRHADGNSCAPDWCINGAKYAPNDAAKPP